MGGGRKEPARRRPSTKRAAPPPPRRWSGVVSRVASGLLALLVLAAGFFLVTTYGEVSAMLERQREALSSSIFSATHRIRIGDDIAHSRLLDRLTALSYTPVGSVATPGEYAKSASEITIYRRGFRRGAQRVCAILGRGRPSLCWGWAKAGIVGTARLLSYRK